jgi:hypothetical protein
MHQSMPRTNRSITIARRVLAAIAFVSASSGSITGCVNPENDYNDFLSRTADARAGGGDLDGSVPVDSALPDGGFSGTYVMACGTSLQPGAKNPILYLATVTYAPSAGGGGQFTFAGQTLQHGATSTSQTVGTPLAAQTVQVDASGKASIVYGPTTIVAAANGVTNQDVTVGSDATLVFLLGANPVCAGNTGHITAPIPLTLNPTKGDVCIVLPATGGTVPTYTDAMFTSSACASL